MMTSSRVIEVALIGEPNSGKSTLLNTILGQKVTAVHKKPQMTRKNFVGIYSKDEFQILFHDTPGFHNYKELLNKEMRRQLFQAIEDSDLVLVLIDSTKRLSHELIDFLKQLTDKEFVFLLNKIDLKNRKILLEDLKKEFPEGECWEISATKKHGLVALLDNLKERAPERDFSCDPDDLTTASTRQVVENLIREKTMEYLGKEVPYQLAVRVVEYHESERKDVIHVDLIVNRESQKPLVIGKGGQMLKKLRVQSTKEIQELLGKKIDLHLFVKVDANWIKDPQKIKDYLGVQ